MLGYRLNYNGKMQDWTYYSLDETTIQAKNIAIKNKIVVSIYITQIPYNTLTYYGSWHPTYNEPVIFIKSAIK